MARHSSDGRRHNLAGKDRDLDLDLDLDPGSDPDPGWWVLVLKYVTRLLFASLLLSCMLVLVVSVLLLGQCRGRVRAVEEVVGGKHAHCSPLPLPAYFVCVVVVVTVFGFGCVGRKVTGLLLTGVSLVAMVIAVLVVVKQDCRHGDQDTDTVRSALVDKLHKCGLYNGNSSINSSGELHPVQQLFRQGVQYLKDDTAVKACTHTATTVRDLCRHYRPVQHPSALLQDGFARHSSPTNGAADQSMVHTKGGEVDQSMADGGSGQPTVNAGVVGANLSMNQTEVEACAREVSRALHALCLRDTEVAFPFLLTLPVFYSGVGLALICIKHADVKAKVTAGTSPRTRSCSVGTNTPRACPGGSPGSARRVLTSCLTSLCLNHALCFTCLLRGSGQCLCCSSPSPAPRPTSRLSFQLRHMKEGELVEEEDEGGEEASLRMLRTTSPPEPHEELRLIDECV